ncbi:hypothetical protein, partial [Nocardioides fonticola]|uniref:hypothetical protein n=1 Tax=Nocardioides fonticola TaxID=450363 RepID=UPI0031E41F01
MGASLSTVFGSHEAPASHQAPALPPPTPHERYRYTLTCKQYDNGICAIPTTCAAPPGTYLVYLEHSTDNGPWHQIWQRCLFPAAATAATGQPTITPALVDHAFQRLDWPASTV